MTSMVFVDTNVLVYADDLADARKNQRANEWLDALWAAHSGRLSTQVLNEYYATVTRKLSARLTQGDARAKVRRFQLWQPWQVDHQTVETAWGLEARFQLSWWDSLIAASASQSGCRILLTEDLQHAQQLGGLTVVNPFIAAPETVLDKPS